MAAPVRGANAAAVAFAHRSGDAAAAEIDVIYIKPETPVGIMILDDMPTYHHRVCDRAGLILHREEIELRDLREALAHANMNVRSLIGRVSDRPFDPRGRIEIADCEGHPIARVYCAEVIAASS